MYVCVNVNSMCGSAVVLCMISSRMKVKSNKLLVALKEGNKEVFMVKMDRGEEIDEKSGFALLLLILSICVCFFALSAVFLCRAEQGKQ